jgi:hypothetical protein
MQVPSILMLSILFIIAIMWVVWGKEPDIPRHWI